MECESYTEDTSVNEPETLSSVQEILQSLMECDIESMTMRRYTYKGSKIQVSVIISRSSALGPNFNYGQSSFEF
mgnify:CR=1 FL=1